MCLSQLAEVARTKRTIVEADETDQQPSVSGIMEPPKKKVRFSGVDTDSVEAEDDASSERTPMASSPRELEVLMEKVRRRAERRKRHTLRSPPPPSSPSEEPRSDKKKPRDLASMQRKLQRLERAIKESARMELKLMNQSKKLREDRAGLTRKYETMANQLREMQQTEHYEGQIFQMGRLPPLMPIPRRVSANQEQIQHLGM